MLEGAVRNLQNSRDPPSMKRAERIRELKKNLKEEATKIGPAGPKLADNRYEKQEECTTQFFKKNRSKHANMNINELYVIDDWDNREVEQPETTTDEEELLIQASCYYRLLYNYKPKKIQQEDMDTMLDTLREKPIPEHIAKRTEGPLTKEQIKTAIRKLGNNKSPGPDGLPPASRILQTIRRHNHRTTTRSNKRPLEIRMPHGNDEARRRSTHIQEKRPERDKELQTNYITQQ